MGGLSGFQTFVLRRRDVLKEVEEHLCTVQSHYEDFFAQIGTIKEEELDQLEILVQQRRRDLPSWLTGRLERIGDDVAEEIDGRIRDLTARWDEQRGIAEKLRTESLELEAEMHGRNVDLDEREEGLKVRSEELLARIERYNRKIREMSGGFGFFYNVLGMRRLRRERLDLDKEQADVAAHIENLRDRWAKAETAHTDAEQRRVEAWQEASNLAAQTQTRLQWLGDSRERVLYRTALERVMAYNPASRPEERSGDRACPACEYGNPEMGVLCQVCGSRLGEDRQDLEGSLIEIGAALHVHEMFSRGMEACQQLIGFVRGLISGHEAFGESVQDMLDTQSKYPLDPLVIEVPERSVAYAALFDELAAGLGGERHIHPLDFAADVQRLIAGRLSEETIQDYFEGRGEALSAAADAQW